MLKKHHPQKRQQLSLLPLQNNFYLKFLLEDFYNER